MVQKNQNQASIEIKATYDNIIFNIEILKCTILFTINDYFPNKDIVELENVF